MLPLVLKKKTWGQIWQADVSLLSTLILTYSTCMEDIGLSLMRPKRTKQLNIQLRKKKRANAFSILRATLDPNHKVANEIYSRSK